MFKSDTTSNSFSGNEKNNSNQPETIIGASVKVEGNFKGDGNLIIEGEVSGSIQTKHDVRVGEQAKVNATIECVNAYISGEVIGNISVQEKLELSSTARVTGDLITPVLQVNAGAKHNGTVKMEDPNTSKFSPDKHNDSTSGISGQDTEIKKELDDDETKKNRKK